VVSATYHGANRYRITNHEWMIIMTRKDYNAIAANLKIIGEQAFSETHSHTSPAWVAFESCVYVISAGMAHENGRFDRARFLVACGVQL